MSPKTGNDAVWGPARLIAACNDAGILALEAVGRQSHKRTGGSKPVPELTTIDGNGISKLCFGAMQFGGGDSGALQRALIDELLKKGEEI